MMTSWQRHTVHIIGPLCRESAGHLWIPSTKGSVMQNSEGFFVVSQNKLLNKSLSGLWNDPPQVISASWQRPILVIISYDNSLGTDSIYMMSSYQYRKSHCGDKTVVRWSYLHNGISYTGKMSSLYWIGALVFIWYKSITEINEESSSNGSQGHYFLETSCKDKIFSFKIMCLDVIIYNFTIT